MLRRALKKKKKKKKGDDEEGALVNRDPLAAGSFRSVHVCEAPGAFICALNHFVETRRVGVETRGYGE